MPATPANAGACLLYAHRHQQHLARHCSRGRVRIRVRAAGGYRCGAVASGRCGLGLLLVGFVRTTSRLCYKTSVEHIRHTQNETADTLFFAGPRSVAWILVVDGKHR